VGGVINQFFKLYVCINEVQKVQDRWYFFERMSARTKITHFSRDNNKNENYAL